MGPIAAAMAASAIPTVASLFMDNGSRPAGPDYSAVMAYLNSPDMRGYRNSLMNTAFDPNADIYRIASDQAYAQANRAAASRGLGNSGAGLGYISHAQTELANKFAENEFQKRLQAYNAVAGRDSAAMSMLTGMANSQYDAAMGAYDARSAGNAGLIKGIGQMANAGLAAYSRQQDLARSQSDLSGYGGRLPGYQGSQPAGYVGGQPVYSQGFNYGTYGK